MSFFARFNRPGATPITPEKFVVRTVREPRPGGSSSPKARSRPLTKSSSTASLKRKHSSDLLKPPRSEASSSRSPLSQRVESSDEDDAGAEAVRGGEEEEEERASKRAKGGETEPSAPCRRIMVNPRSFRKASPTERNDDGNFVHADMIANVKMKSAGKSLSRVFDKSEMKLLTVKMQYPGITHPERYELVRFADSDEFSPEADILNTMELVAKHLLARPESKEILSDSLTSNSGGIVYNMRRAIRNNKPHEFLHGLNKYNNLIVKYRKDGSIRSRIANMTAIPFPMVEHILSQAYARTVAPEVESLKDYEAFTSNVYGELLPKFTTKLFKESGLTAEKVFVDLGSGTGNVALHAALEIGCESWGCEIMKNATALADKQKREFAARCRMWGINPGKFRLEKGDFLESSRIAEALKRADVVLVNNYMFASELNQRLLNLFLDLKEGTQIISLKPFVSTNHVITTRNAENPVSRLRVEEKEYFSNSVSWTNAGGKYYVQTVDGSMLRTFFNQQTSKRTR